MELSKDKCQMSTQVSTSSTRLSVENRARLGRLEDTLDFSERQSCPNYCRATLNSKTKPT